jgi:hypothetical protein
MNSSLLLSIISSISILLGQSATNDIDSLTSRAYDFDAAGQSDSAAIALQEAARIAASTNALSDSSIAELHDEIGGYWNNAGEYDSASLEYLREDRKSVV